MKHLKIMITLMLVALTMARPSAATTIWYNPSLIAVPPGTVSIPVYGNWCGPDNPKDSTTKPHPLPWNAIDEACMWHDLNHADSSSEAAILQLAKELYSIYRTGLMWRYSPEPPKGPSNRHYDVILNSELEDTESYVAYITAWLMGEKENAYASVYLDEQSYITSESDIRCDVAAMLEKYSPELVTDILNGGDFQLPMGEMMVIPVCSTLLPPRRLPELLLIRNMESFAREDGGKLVNTVIDISSTDGEIVDLPRTVVEFYIREGKPVR